MKSFAYSKICRLCLSEERSLTNIFEEHLSDLAANIFHCVSIQIFKDDSLPQSACSNCIDSVENWLSFKRICQKSNEILSHSFNADLYENDNKVDIKHSSEHLTDDQFLDSNNENGDITPIDNVDIKPNQIPFQTNAKNLDFLPADTQNSINNNKCVISRSKRLLRSVYLNKKHVVKKRKKTVPTRTKSKQKTIKNINSETKDKEYKKTKKRVPEEHFFEDDNDVSDKEENLNDFLNLLEKKDLVNQALEYDYICEFCSEKQLTLFDYLDHQSSHDGQPVFRCDRCPEIVFTTRNDLVFHESRHQVPCPKCEKMVLPCSLKAHLIAHTDTHKCSICSMRFSNSSTLATHNLVAHTDIKNHVCETCGKRFRTKTALKTHRKIHSDVRDYPCKLCSYAGRTASSLYIHMSRHENGLCVCEICAKTFKSGRCLKDHMRRVHSSIKRHECNYCQKKFVDKYMLTVHLRTHTGARPYQCKVCDKAFVRSDGLKEHMATHGERASYHCEQCGKRFIYRRSLSRHTCNSL